MAKNTGNGLGNLADAFHSAEQGLQLDNIGRGGYDVGPDLAPKRVGGRVQTPAQHAAVKKAAAVSVAHRRDRATVGGGAPLGAAKAPALGGAPKVPGLKKGFGI